MVDQGPGPGGADGGDMSLPELIRPPHGPPARWRDCSFLEVQWDQWGLAVWLSFGHWYPREWSLHVQVGPVIGGIGVEETYEYDDWRWEQRANVLLSTVDHPEKEAKP